MKQFELNAAARLQWVEAAGKGEAWWDSLTTQQQKDYIKLHPQSKYSKDYSPYDTYLRRIGVKPSIKEEKEKAKPKGQRIKETKKMITDLREKMNQAREARGGSSRAITPAMSKKLQELLTQLKMLGGKDD